MRIFKSFLVLSIFLQLLTVEKSVLAEENPFRKEIADSGIHGDPCAQAPRDPKLWNKSVAFGLSYTDGNSETTVLNLNTKIDRDYKQDIWKFELDANYGESASDVDEDREKNKEDIKATGSYKYLFNKKTFAAIGANYLYDDIADIDYRAIVTPGLGYFLLKSEEFKLSVEAGPAYVFEKVGGEKNNYLAPRIADGFDWQINETSKFFQTAEVLFDAEDSEDTIVNATVGIASAINSSLSLVFSIKDNFDNQPAKGSERNDVAIVTALQVSL